MSANLLHDWNSHIEAIMTDIYNTAYARGKASVNTDCEEQSQWTPCSERLPEDPDTYASKTYQVTTDDGRTRVLRWHKTEIRGKMVMRWEWHDGRIYHGDVLAWKPLSEPYKKER